MDTVNFDNIVTQAAYLLWQHMPDGCASFLQYGETHVLVDYSPVLLRNIGETTTADQLARATNSAPGVVWIVVGTHGDVRMRRSALSNHEAGRETVAMFETAQASVEETA